MGKLGARDRTHAVALAERRGIIRFHSESACLTTPKRATQSGIKVIYPERAALTAAASCSGTCEPIRILPPFAKTTRRPLSPLAM